MTQLRQLTVLAAGNQVELLEELLFLADAQAVTLVDNGDTPILEPPVGGHPVWSQTQVNALFHDERPQSEILKDIDGSCCFDSVQFPLNVFDQRIINISIFGKGSCKW